MLLVISGLLMQPLCMADEKTSLAGPMEEAAVDERKDAGLETAANAATEATEDAVAKEEDDEHGTANSDKTAIEPAESQAESLGLQRIYGIVHTLGAMTYGREDYLGHSGIIRLAFRAAVACLLVLWHQDPGTALAGRTNAVAPSKLREGTLFFWTVCWLTSFLEFIGHWSLTNVIDKLLHLAYSPQLAKSQPHLLNFVLISRYMWELFVHHAMAILAWPIVFFLFADIIKPISAKQVDGYADYFYIGSYCIMLTTDFQQKNMTAKFWMTLIALFIQFAAYAYLGVRKTFFSRSQRGGRLSVV